MEQKNEKTNLVVNLVFLGIYMAAAALKSPALSTLAWILWLVYLAWGIWKHPRDKFVWALHGSLILLVVVLLAM